MRIPVFLSYPKPHLAVQQDFIQKVEEYFHTRGLEPRTLGVTDYDMDAPLKAIRRLMLESNGLITIAFRRTFIAKAQVRKGSNMPDTQESEISDFWLSTPYCQIEPAMAFQLGLPILVFRERGVLAEGLLEKGVVGLYMPEFSLSASTSNYFQSEEWKQVIGKWEGAVRQVVETKGNPPKLF